MKRANAGEGSGGLGVETNRIVSQRALAPRVQMGSSHFDHFMLEALGKQDELRWGGKKEGSAAERAIEGRTKRIASVRGSRRTQQHDTLYKTSYPTRKPR